MSPETLDFISILQKNSRNIRNICLLAHVDHGKTTLADCLIASNGIISARLAGKLRYMDSREDEQQRGITMKSSAISLVYHQDGANFLVNLIDSPGHVDFSTEVSTGIRLCDGALVVVDVVEGVCPQTHVVLRQAWLEGIKPCLVLNKIDRLLTELRLSPEEAYKQLKTVLEQVNAITGTLFSARVMEESSNAAKTELSDEQSFDWSSGLENADDERLYFAPSQGNVVFASSLDGWAFGINTFAKLYSQKLGISVHVLQKTLWGDYYLNMKAKKISKGAFAKGKKPLFVQFVLENIWSIYEAVMLNREMSRIDKIVSNLNLKISTRDSKFADPRLHLQAILRQWLPLSIAVLRMVCSSLPAPCDITTERALSLMCGRFKNLECYPSDTQSLKDDIIKCSSSHDAPVIVYVSKMISIPVSSFPQSKKMPLSELEIKSRYEDAKKRLVNKETSPVVEMHEEEEVDSTEECFVAFARVFSGVMKKGVSLYVLGPKYSPHLREKEVVTKDSEISDMFGSSTNNVSECSAEDLYLMMGRELSPLEEVPAGNILGILGFGKHILKSATISSTMACPPFTPMPLEAKPIVRVAVEPKQPSQLHLLVNGMKLLNQADPSVEVLVQETGEYVIVAAGEVHLQRCLDDLSNRYAGIKIKASAPIVPFRETVVAPPKVDMVNEEIGGLNRSGKHHIQRLPAYMLKEIQTYCDVIKKEEVCCDTKDETETFSKTQLTSLRKASKQREKIGVIEAYTADKQYCVSLHAKPLPIDVLECLEQHSNLLRIIQRTQSDDDSAGNLQNLSEQIKGDIRGFYGKLKQLLADSGRLWKNVIDNIWSIGPKGGNNNILINNIHEYKRASIWTSVLEVLNSDEFELREFDHSIISGFQLAAQSGPMCEEPLMGVAFFIEDWKRVDESTSNGPTQSFGPLSGLHIAAVRVGCRRAMMSQPLRLKVAMYSCTIQTTSEVLGKIYGVVGRREGKVISEEMREGSDVFDIVAQLPVAESFGFAEEIRKRSSGLASPQLVFNHWETIDVDPFWTPTTEEEYELFGEKADSENQALKYLTQIRKRKGLYVEEKTVLHAEKQRTLKKNK